MEVTLVLLVLLAIVFIAGFSEAIFVVAKFWQANPKPDHPQTGSSSAFHDERLDCCDRFGFL